MEQNANRQRNALNGAAARIAGIYLAVAVVWIYASDRILASLVGDRDLLSVAQTWKGWFFVVTTAALLFVLVRRDLGAMHLANATTRTLANRLQHYLTVGPTITYAMRFEHGEMLPDWVSDNILELLGYTATEALAPGWWQAHIHPEDRARVMAAQPTLRREHVLLLEYRFLRKDGTELWVLDKLYLLRDADGLPDKVVGAWTDITERKRAEQALAESELKYRLIADGTEDWVYWIDTDNRFRYISPACERVTGYAFEDFVANPDLLREIAHPDDREAVRQHLETCHNESGGAQLEFRILHKNGEERWIGHSCAPIYTPEGQYAGRRGTNRNITEHKQAEEALRHALGRLQSFVDANIVGVVIASTSGEIYEANDYYLRMIGYSRVEFELGLVDWRAITPAEWQQADEKTIQELLQHGTSAPYEKEYLRRDGTRVAAYLCDALLPGTEETIVAFVLDITERKRAENEVRRLYLELEDRVRQRTAELEAVNRELEAFAYSISHDLRAPLRAIDGFTHILLDEYAPRLDAEGERICGIVSANTRRMGQLIDDLLAFSRLGRAEFRPVAVDMSALAAAAFAEVATAQERAPIDFRLAPLPRAIGDPALLRQVWLNLLGNAVKFSTHVERPAITVAAVERGGEMVYVVSDNGAGFDMRYADKLFGVFQRLHGEQEFPGTGLGLALAQRIVQRHGGRIWGEGEPGKGATFYFTTPGGGPNHA